MHDKLSRSFTYAWEFYLKRLGIIVTFSVPFILAFLIPTLVPAPTYLALGGVFLRTGSLPDLTMMDMVITALAYAMSVFIIADTIVNINIVVRSKRTLTTIKHEVIHAVGTYATRIFYIYTMALLLMFIFQLLTYDHPIQTWFYPFLSFVLSFLLFFVPPAVVIDNSDTPTAIKRSITMAIKNPHFVLVWAITSLVLVSIVKLVADLLFASPFSSYFVLLINCLLILPFLTILQTQIYMEKYPLAR
ncbi:Uncharacterised protein [Candidatus Bilamarchaeum dharawalense]|uniref:Uncharacterized protein n=1 Tax=Candidatus Bilamarchaeum dharawalense TaxID=2885759 RepID=A0A5E4LM24_9ARCH|nr:Uncharacterised protein [Candidatus Bilamarchaeum dharawalense]